jgi:3-hydroxyacyl-[acyl-carrier-protein] dehydratase
MPKAKYALDVEAIKRRLPHRYPFLLVDRILESNDRYAIGLKNVSVNEPFFQGHFPGVAIMPGALVAEAMAQTAAFIDPGEHAEPAVPPAGGRRMFLSGMQMQFKRPVVPGDALWIKVEMVKALGPMVRCRGECRVDGELVARGDISLAEVPE